MHRNDEDDGNNTPRDVEPSKLEAYFQMQGIWFLLALSLMINLG